MSEKQTDPDTEVPTEEELATLKAFLQKYLSKPLLPEFMRAFREQSIFIELDSGPESSEPEPEEAGLSDKAFPIVRKTLRADDPQNAIKPLRVTMDYTSVARKTLDPSMLGPEPTIPIPDAPCPRCENKTLKRTPTTMVLYDGLVACSTEGCGYRDGFRTWAAKSLFPIQKMPDGAKVFYHKDPEESEE